MTVSTQRCEPLTYMHARAVLVPCGSDDLACTDYSYRMQLLLPIQLFLVSLLRDCCTTAAFAYIPFETNVTCMHWPCMYRLVMIQVRVHAHVRQTGCSSWVFMNGCTYLGGRRANRAKLRQQEGSDSLQATGGGGGRG